MSELASFHCNGITKKGKERVRRERRVSEMHSREAPGTKTPGKKRNMGEYTGGRQYRERGNN